MAPLARRHVLAVGVLSRVRYACVRAYVRACEDIGLGGCSRVCRVRRAVLGLVKVLVRSHFRYFGRVGTADPPLGPLEGSLCKLHSIPSHT